MRSKPTAIDLYSGVGGWTLGLKMAGVLVVRSYEWWEEANETHNKNFKTHNSNIDIRKLELEDLPEPGSIDFVVGSPPCTQFSYSNRGGSGDILDGLQDVHKFLEVVRYLEPRYWVMENVPRVAKILERELGIGGSLSQFTDLVTVISVEDMSRYGLPQVRKRMFAGNFPLDLLRSYQPKSRTLTLGEVKRCLEDDTVVDPIYGIKIPQASLTDNEHEVYLSDEEARMNRASKEHHHIYNIMRFPDELDRPSRTITATCTRVSRESIVVADGTNDNSFRRLSPRERAVLQSFPVTFQFYGKSHSSKLKMIGNAVPPLMTYQLTMAMREVPASKYEHPSQRKRQHQLPKTLPPRVPLNGEGRTFPTRRNFRFAIPNLRFHSGTRFEFKNSFNAQSVNWGIEFVVSSSGGVLNLPLDDQLFLGATSVLDKELKKVVNRILKNKRSYLNGDDALGLQKVWNGRRGGRSPFEIMDVLGSVAAELEEILEEHDSDVFEEFVLQMIDDNETINSTNRNRVKKVKKHSKRMFAGVLVGSWFNSLSCFTEPVEMNQ